MQKMYLLEVYHFENDCWSTIGTFVTREEAQKEKERIEREHNWFCGVFEVNAQNCFAKK